MTTSIHSTSTLNMGDEHSKNADGTSPGKHQAAQKSLATQLSREEDISDEDYDSLVVDEEKLSSYNPDLLPPDGGYGWVVSLAAMFCSFSTWGVNASYGVFLDYYLTHNTFAGATKIDYAFIGGIVVCLAMGLAPASAFLVRIFGTKPVIIVGVTLQSAGYLLASFSTKLWQIFLTQGFLVGISFILVFMPATLALPSWFTTKKATSFGIANSGSGLGGLVFSLSISKILEGPGGHQWALRMVCFVTTFTSGVALLLLKPFNEKPQPPLRQRLTKEHLKKAALATCDLSIFYKHYALAFLASWFCITLIGYVLVLFLVASYASSIGLTNTQASNLTSIVNAAQLAGRPIMGFIADKCGRYNSAIGFTAYGMIVIFAIWVNASNYGILIAFCATFGMVCGVGVTLGLSLASDYLGAEHSHHITTAWGGLNILSFPFSLTSGVMGLALTQDGADRPYLHSQIFAGCTFAYGVIALFPVREFLVRRNLSVKLDDVLTRMEGIQHYDGEKSIQDELIDLQNQKERLESILQPTKSKYLYRCFHASKV